MKKLISTFFIICFAITLSHAVDYPGRNFSINISTFVNYSDSNIEIKNGDNSAGFLHGVIVANASTSGDIKLYDTQGSTSAKQIATIDTSTTGDYHFNIRLSSGLTTHTADIADIQGITIIYR